MAKKSIKKKDDRSKMIVLFVIVVIAAFFLWKSNIFTKGEPAIINRGVALGAKIVDENGNLREYLTKPVTSGTQSVISAQTPSGFRKISPPSCVSSCEFLALTTKLDNSVGTTDITVNGVTGTIACNEGNSDPGCSAVPNVLGLAGSPPTTKRGNLNAKWTAYPLPLELLKGASSVTLDSDPMSVDEVSFGLMKFRVDLTGTYKDQQGIDQPLTGKFGTLVLRVAPSLCSIDNTPLDTCSTVTVGKYCAVGAGGVPTLIDKASQCGCPSGKIRAGEVCVTGACTIGCLAGSIDYCLDGSSTEPRCFQCGQANCPKDAYDQSANGCNPATTGVFSVCTYPTVTESGFAVSFNPVEITPIAECGDGIKTGTEQCDNTDFGGCHCASGIAPPCSLPQAFSGGTLACTVGCAYNTAGCTAAYIKFRTSSLTYESGWIAFADNGCGLNLVSSGHSYTSGTLSGRTCMEYLPGLSGGPWVNQTTVPGSFRGDNDGEESPSLWISVNAPGEYRICDSDTSTVYKRYRTTDADKCEPGDAAYPVCISKLAEPAYTGMEVSC